MSVTLGKKRFFFRDLLFVEDRRTQANDFCCCRCLCIVFYDYQNGKNEEIILDTTERTVCAETEAVRKHSMKKINMEPDIAQDNADLLELEERYNSLRIPHNTRRVIDDYIACILSRQERMESLIYYAGRNDVQN